MEKYPDEVPFLVAQSGPLNGQRWPLRRAILIGRDSTCDIVIPDRQVSRHHARVTISKDGILLEDLDSKNGTHYNGQSLEQSIILQDGDVIQIALAQKFVYLSSDSTIPLDESDLENIEFLVKRDPIKEELTRLRLDKRSRRVWVNIREDKNSINEIEILPPLSVSQFRLLEILYDNQGRVVPRQDLVVAVWGKEQAFEVSEQALDALVRRLRDRISEVDDSHAYVITVRGHGLRLDNPTL